jgi:hypothetical protein
MRKGSKGAEFLFPERFEVVRRKGREGKGGERKVAELGCNRFQSRS